MRTTLNRPNIWLDAPDRYSGIHTCGNVYWLVSLRLFSHSSFQDNGMPIYRTILDGQMLKLETLADLQSLHSNAVVEAPL